MRRNLVIMLSLAIIGVVIVGLLTFAFYFYMNKSPAPDPQHKEKNKLQHSIYIWQRVWTHALIESLEKVKVSIKDVYVLVLEKDSDGKIFNVSINDSALNSAELPVYAVIRMDGRVEQLLDDDFVAQIFSLSTNLQKKLPRLSGIEVDYDCPTSQLTAYSEFLKKLRAVLPLQLKLSNTALPTWLESAELQRLLSISDESVLQVHAVLNPKQGLFDSRQALSWVKQYQKIAHKPFQIALPAYGSKVLFSQDERILDIQSEQRRFNPDEKGLELNTEPEDVAKFIHDLPKNNPVNIIWFRLPTTNDSRAWPLESLMAVMNQQELKSTLIATIISEKSAIPDKSVVNDKNHNPDETTELLTLDLLNQGNIAMNLPNKIHVSPVQNCTAADGLNGYYLELGKNSWIFKRDEQKKISPQKHMSVAWLRCFRSLIGADSLIETDSSTGDGLHVSF